MGGRVAEGRTCPASAPAIAFRSEGWNPATSSRHLAPNDVYGYAKTGTIPAGTAAGDYTIVIRADADGTVPEVNEGDNAAGKPLKVTR